jgi:hypothetical protein
MSEYLKLKLWLALFLLVGFGGYHLFRQGARAVSAAPFAPHLHEYLQAPQRPAPGQAAPRVKGGFLLMDLDRKGVDGLHESLPGHLRAKGPEEVATVVWLRWVVQTAGRGRYRWVCRATVIDRADNLIVGEETFTGPPPTGRASLGGKPTHEIILYLYSLQTAKAEAPGR